LLLPGLLRRIKAVDEHICRQPSTFLKDLTMLNQTTRFVLAVTAVAAALTTPASANESSDPNAYLVRPGEWSQGVGSYLLTGRMNDTTPAHWPRDSWYQITHTKGALNIRAIQAPSKGLPDFLTDVANQVVAGQSDTPQTMNASQAVQAEGTDTQYLRAPGVKLREGRVPTVKFSSGVLSPKLDHPYKLALGDTPFTLTVQNGLRSKTGAPYGDGALYTIGYGGEIYTYFIGQFGWDSMVRAVADIDGDNKPDFVIYVGGNNGSDEFVLLSSQAKPGMNQPTAVLSSQGC
jgi:hypothetical protein